MNSTNLNIAQISCGENHSGFVTEDGKLYMFGSNENYQLGLGNTNETTSPTLVPNHTQKGSGLENIISVECGNSYTIIIKKEGNNYYRYVFGLNSEGQLGNNSTTTVQVPKKQDWGQSNISKISQKIIEEATKKYKVMAKHIHLVEMIMDNWGMVIMYHLIYILQVIHK